MSALDPPLLGGCRCGGVRLKVGARPLMTLACHCRGCQRMTSSAYSLGAVLPADALEVTAGEPVIGGMHGASRHFFCPHCMSWLFTRPEGMDAVVVLRSTMLDDPLIAPPFVETWTQEKLPFAATSAVHSYPGFPPPEDFPRLATEFAARAE